MITGSATSAMSHSFARRPPPAAAKAPAMAASPPAIAHDSANTAPTETPWASAASWS